MAERSRRQRRGEAEKLSVFEELVNARKGAKKRLESFAIAEEAPVYDVVNEQEYADIVAKRREAGGAFVEGEDTLGYDDMGEDNWDVAEDEYEDQADGSKKRGRKEAPEGQPADKKKAVPAKAKSALAMAAAARGGRSLQSMWAKGGMPGAGAAKPKNPKDAEQANSVLDDILAGIAPDASDRQRVRQDRPPFGSSLPASTPVRLAPTTPFSAIPEAFAPRNQATPSSAPAKTFAPRNQATPTSAPLFKHTGVNERTNEAEQGDDFEFPAPDEPMPDASLGPELSFGANLAAEEEGPEIATGQAAGRERDAGSKRKVEVKVESEAAEVPAQNAPVAAKPEPAETHVKEEKPNPKRQKVPLQETASAGWQAVWKDGPAPAALPPSPKAEPQRPIDDQALPLTEDGCLPFFFLDAHEETFGGAVYLFGKVLLEKEYVSCCVRIQNLQRSIIAVPANDSLSDPELLELETAVPPGKPNPALFKKLHALSSAMKQELQQVLISRGIENFSFLPVKKTYAFERADVPKGEGYFLELNYPYKCPPLEADLAGEHFTALFGTHTSALELLLLQREMMGPGWLLIAKPQRVASSPVSWCKLEVSVDSPEDVSVEKCPIGVKERETPPLVVASLNLKTVINHQQNVNEIAAASVVYNKGVKIDGPTPKADWNTQASLGHFTVVQKLVSFPVGFTSDADRINAEAGHRVLFHEINERALLNCLVANLKNLDADVLVGHNISGFDLDVLLHRLEALKVHNWSCIGRLKRTRMPKLGGGGDKYGGGAGPGIMMVTAGRLLCDTYLSARELLKEVSYSLSQLASSQLGEVREDLDPADIPAMYHSSQQLQRLVRLAETDAWLSLGLMFHLSVLPLTRQLTCLSGNLWGKTLQGARAQRIEYLLLHEFYGRGFILPDKLTAKEREAELRKAKNKGKPEEEGDDEGEGEAPAGKRKKGPSYLGGLVLEPKKGLYDKYILLLDFNSLYPSIIQEYNICFTTVERAEAEGIPSLPKSDTPGVLPQVLKQLVERRRQVKNMLKNEQNPIKRQQHDIRQQALKLTANSMYGCLGFSNSRFYAKPIAELVTSQGREILQSTVDLVGNLNLEVIYGDTDSIMINTGSDDIADVRAKGAAVKKEVNKRYRLLEIEMDGIFKRMLLLKKKKYAALKVEPAGDGTLREVMEMKGLDIVRRDWSVLSKDIGNYCLEQILRGDLSKEEVVEAIHSELRKLREDMDSGLVPLEKFVITKTLTKPPEDYPDAKNQPHVQVALRFRQAGKREACQVGATIPYIICREKDSLPQNGAVAERARHIDEITPDGAWQPDIDYYLAQQVHPVVSRLCAPIEGTDAARIADCLGIDAAKYHQQAATPASAREDALLASGSTLDDDDRYKDCQPLHLTCPGCHSNFPFGGVAALLKPTPLLENLVTVKTEPVNPGSPASVLSPQRSVGAPASPPAPGPGNAASPSTPSSAKSGPLDVLACPTCGTRSVTPAMLANQVKLRAEEQINRYYEGWLRCDDDMCDVRTRNVCGRVLSDAERGSVCPNYPRCNGKLSREYTEADLYKQLSHFHRLLDLQRALLKMTDASARPLAESRTALLRLSLDRALVSITRIMDRSAYKWVNMGDLFAALRV